MVRGLEAASLKVSGVVRGRREESELRKDGGEKEKKAGPGGSGLGPSQPLVALLAFSVGRLGQDHGEETALSARMSGPVSHADPSGWEQSWCQAP